MGLCQGQELLMLFALRRLGEKFRVKNKELLFIFMSLNTGCKTAVSVDGELSSSSPVKVGVHKGSALIPLLLIMDVIMDA